MAFNIAYTYQLVNKYTAPMGKIISATKQFTKTLKESKEALRLSNEMLVKMTANAGKVGTAVTRLANRSERLNGAFKALQHNNAFEHLTTQARAFNDQMDRMHRVQPNIPGFGPGGGGVPGQPAAPGGRGRETAGGRMSRFGAAASGLTGLGTGIGISKVLQQTAAVENAMIDMGRATDLPAAELRKFEERFMSLSEQIGISADKLAIMAYEGSKTGIDTKDLDKYVKLTANAAVSFEILEEEAGRALGSIKAKMGLNIDQLTKMMDVTNFVADATSADGGRMIEILERLSGQFKTLHLPPEIAAGFAGIADQLETSPELAASGMNMVINKLMESKEIAKGLFDAPAETMRAVFQKFADMPEIERIAEINKRFGPEAGRFAIKIAGNMALFEETMKKAADAKAMGSMEREMASKLKSLTMLWKNMKNAVTNVMVAIGEGLAPDIKRFSEYLREVTPKIREFVREHPGIVKFAAAIAATVAVIALAVPVAWALGAAFAFMGSAVMLLVSPIGLAVAGVAALGAAIAWRWDEWVWSGHPVPELVGKIADSIGRIIDRFKVLTSDSPVVGKAIELIGGAFDVLGYALVIPLKLLETYLSVLEKIIGTQADIKPISGANIGNLVPPRLQAATNVGAMTSQQQAPATVNGMITVKAEPGTTAKVSQPNLPTGSNLLRVK